MTESTMSTVYSVVEPIRYEGPQCTNPLAMPFWCFHDRDVAPEGATPRESNAHLDAVLERAARKMQDTGVQLLSGTANLFSHGRYMGGAATNPDPEVFAYAAAQVKHMLEWTQRLNGANYVLWGGREGYETLLNTRLAAELDHYGRFLAAGERYAGWDSELGRQIEAGASLEALAHRVHRSDLSPQPRSGRQERLENLVNRYV